MYLFIGKSSSESLVPKRVGLSHISQVISEVDGDRMTLIQEGAQDSFPLQQKILVCSLLLLTRQLKTKEVTLGKVSWGCRQMELGERWESALQSRYFPKGLSRSSWIFNRKNKHRNHVKGSWLYFPWVVVENSPLIFSPSMSASTKYKAPFLHDSGGFWQYLQDARSRILLKRGRIGYRDNFCLQTQTHIF